MASTKNSGPFCVVMRFTTHESRGAIQRIASASAPDCISHTHASIAVLPAPITTKRRGKGASCAVCHRLGNALGGTTRTPAPISNRGRWVDGTGGL